MRCRRLLAGALFNKKEPQAEGDAHPFEDAAHRLLGKLQMYHTVQRPSEQAWLSAAPVSPEHPFLGSSLWSRMWGHKALWGCACEPFTVVSNMTQYHVLQ